jgi:hypothetical protein
VAFWWVGFLLAVWSVLCDDVRLLPFAVVAGSFCVHNHVEYTALVGVLLTAATGWTLRRVVLERRGGSRGGRTWRWLLAAVVAGIVVWIPPVVDEVRRDPGNLSILLDHFGSPPEEAIGLTDGTRLLLAHLSPWRLVNGAVTGEFSSDFVETGSEWPGTVLLVAWAGSVAVAWRLRLRDLLRLDLVLGIVLVVGALSLARIFGQVWFWLGLWGFGTASLMLLAIGWALAALVASRRASVWQPRAALALGLVLLTTTVFSAADAARSEGHSPALSRFLGSVMPPTVAAIESGDVPGGGRRGRYLVTWDDPINIGIQAYGVVNELDRAGLRAGMEPAYGTWVTRHRVLHRRRATAVVHVAVGPAVEEWRRRPSAVEVAFADPRSPAERTEYRRLEAETIRDLRRAGLDDLVDRLGENVVTTSLDPRTPPSIQRQIQRMAEIGLPSAVFVAPPVTPA